MFPASARPGMLSIWAWGTVLDVSNRLLETPEKENLAKDMSPVCWGEVRSLIREPLLPQPLVGVLAAENSCPMVPQGLDDVGG
eukprot:6675927-Pyramimonas_sp.AAC.1